LNKYLLKFIIGLLISSSLVFGQGWLKSKRIQDQIQKAAISYNEGNFARSEEILKSVLDNKPGEFRSTVLMLLIKTSVHLNKDKQVKTFGRDFLKNYPQSKYLDEIYLSYGDMYIENGKYSIAFNMLLNSRKHVQTDSTLFKIDERINKTIQYTIEDDFIEELLSIEHDDTIRSIILLAKALSFLENGDQTGCSEVLALIKPATVPNNYFDLYERLILESFQPVSPTGKVGLVIPLNGKDQIRGRAFFAGFQKGFEDSKSTDKISIVIHDNLSNDIETIRGVQRLTLNKDILAIIGPINDSNALLASTALINSRVPFIIPISVQDELTELSPTIFQLNPTLEIQGRYAARTALLELGLDSIAVITPTQGMGYQLASAFIAEMEMLGVQPVLIESYSEIPENLSRQFKSIRKKAWSLIPEEKETDEFLGMEIDSLDALFDISGEDFFDIPDEKEVKMTSRDSSKVVLETIHGLYIPIVPEHLHYLATQLPMYNLSTTVIGNEAWQNLDILNEKNIGPHLDSMIVITPTVNTDMVENLSTEESFYFTQGYDCAGFITTTLETTIANRRKVVDRINSIDEFHGSGKVISFSDSTKNYNTALQVMMYHNNVFESLGYFKGDSLYTGESELPDSLIINY